MADTSPNPQDLDPNAVHGCASGGSCGCSGGTDDVSEADMDAPMDGNQVMGTYYDGGKIENRSMGGLALTRREFATSMGIVTGAIAAAGCSGDALEVFKQTRLREMTQPQVKEFLARLEREYKAKYNTDITVGATPPAEGVKFAYALDLSRCIGCRRCVHACVKENNQSRPNPEGEHNNPIQWIKVLEMEKEKGINLEEADPYYNPDKVPREGHFYMPVACQQCENPPCTKVCPVQATWKEADGIVVIDYDWCIGCRYCMVACPYGARRFNWAEPHLPQKDINPNTHVLGNRPRSKGVVEKCTWCIQRVRNGRYPACVEICPVGARKFGNLNDPHGEIRAVLENKRVYILKEDLNTQPKFFYFFGV
jgi:molybdopterin-containing oxidoreductase family iron-sulfur binding subunit